MCGTSAHSLLPALAGELAAREVQLTEQQLASLADYCHRLWSWNQRMNLTRHTDVGTFVARDVIDSLVIAAQLVPGETLLDLGTGGGVPGVVIAVLRPDVTVSVSESVAKKAAAVQDIVAGMELPVRVFAERGEQVLVRHAFDTVTVRAVGRMERLLRLVAPHWAAIGRLLLLKGPQWIAERAVCRHAGLLRPLQLRKLVEYRSGAGISVLLQLSPKPSSS